MTIQHLNNSAVHRILTVATRNFQTRSGHCRNYSAKRHRLASLEPGRTIFQTLRGRDLISFNGYTRNDIFSLLWIATDIKAARESSLQIASGKRICLVWSNPLTKLSLTSASHRLNASLSSFHENQFPNSANLGMIGRTFGSSSDIVFLEMTSWKDEQVEEFAHGCSCPVVVVSSLEYCPVIAYAELLTLFEKYEFLRRLEITCINYGNKTLLKTYFTLLPAIGMHLRYITFGESGLISALEKGIQLSLKNNTEIRQFESVQEALFRSHCLSTNITNAAVIGKQIGIKDVKEMDLDWSLLQYDSFNGLAVSDEFLKAAKHNLIFKAIENLEWIFQAAVVAFTTEYSPKTVPPRFEGVD